MVFYMYIHDLSCSSVSHCNFLARGVVFQGSPHASEFVSFPFSFFVVHCSGAGSFCTKNTPNPHTLVPSHLEDGVGKR